MPETSSLAGRHLDRPTRDLLRFGNNALARELAGLEPGYVLVTQPGPRQHLDPQVVRGAGAVLEVLSLDRQSLAELVASAGTPQDVVGIGGGVVMDSAKWLAEATSARLTLAPSSISVDACVTNTVAVRDQGGVVYEGFVVPEKIVVDIDLVRTAPPRMNRAGVGDLLSIHTALWDWEVGAASGGVAFDDAAATASARILDGIEAVAAGIAGCEQESLRAVLAGYADINDMTVRAGHAQMEEGSEHYFAYAVEQATGRGFVHGELVSLGVIIMSRLQGNDPGRARRIAELAGVTWRPADLGLDHQTVTAVLGSLETFVRDTHLPYSVINEVPITAPVAERLLEGLF